MTIEQYLQKKFTFWLNRIKRIPEPADNAISKEDVLMTSIIRISKAYPEKEEKEYDNLLAVAIRNRLRDIGRIHTKHRIISIYQEKNDTEFVLEIADVSIDEKRKRNENSEYFNRFIDDNCGNGWEQKGRDILRLKCEGYQLQEIAESRNENLNTVKSYYSQFRHKIKKRYEEAGTDLV